MDKQVFADPLDEIIEQVLQQVTSHGHTDEEKISAMIDEVIFQMPVYQHLSIKEKRGLAIKVFHRMCGYDILQPLLEDESISEIMCNGYQTIFVERHGRLEKTPLAFSEESYYRGLLHKIASDMNRKIDFSSPIVDARLKDGSRVNIVLDPVALNGPILTIRKFSKSVFSLDDLAGMNSISKEGVDLLKKSIKDRKNIFIAGGTGSGKTTLLNALCKEIQDNQRIVTVEDSAEITIESVENVVTLEKRNPNMEGKGEITIASLIKTALRMRPDRIIVGEIRGKEAIDMLQAMNTGHAGSISTGHSNSTLDMLRRIETMVLSGLEIPIVAIKQQIASAIDIIVYLERERGGQRRVVAIDALEGHDTVDYQLRSLYPQGES